MSISYMGKAGIVQVPTLSGVNLEILKRVSDIENEVESLKRSVAGSNSYGLAKYQIRRV